MEFYYKDEWLTYSQKEALKAYNRAVSMVQGFYNHSENGLIKIRREALKKYLSAGYSALKLAEALLFLRPHWIYGGAGEDLIREYFVLLQNEKKAFKNHSDQMFITMSTNRYLRELAGDAPLPDQQQIEG